jgi:hypothetical protein
VSRFGDFGLGAPHDPSDSHGLARISDDQVIRAEGPLDPIERDDLLSGARAPHYDPLPFELVIVERVGGMAQLQEHIICCVYDVADGAQAALDESMLNLERRRPPADIAEEAARVARAAVNIFNLYGSEALDLFGALGESKRRFAQIKIIERADLPSDPKDAERVRPVRFRL